MPIYAPSPLTLSQYSMTRMLQVASERSSSGCSRRNLGAEAQQGRRTGEAPLSHQGGGARGTHAGQPDAPSSVGGLPVPKGLVRSNCATPMVHTTGGSISRTNSYSAHLADRQRS